MGKLGVHLWEVIATEQGERHRFAVPVDHHEIGQVGRLDGHI